MDKIVKLRNEMLPSPPSSNAQTAEESTEKLDSFHEVSEEQILKLILGGNSKSCCLDSLPTNILKQILPSLLPLISSIVNKRLRQMIMSTSLKQAVVTPLLKKTSLDKENLKNYPPVSNLPYLGKCIEKVAIKQMEDHLSENDLHEPLLSAYKTYHSTETSLAKVTGHSPPT